MALQLSELWEYRELLYFLTWREVKVRYKQTALGAAWAIIQPLFTMLFVLLVGMMAFYRQAPPARCVYLPLFFLLAFVTALGVGLWLSALNVRYRDVRYTIPFLTQFWMFLAPTRSANAQRRTISSLYRTRRCGRGRGQIRERLGHC